MWTLQIFPLSLGQPPTNRLVIGVAYIVQPLSRYAVALHVTCRLQHSATFAPSAGPRSIAWPALVQLGLRQARYMGHHKTAAQIYLTATVAKREVTTAS